ncbi:AraC family transcriptional regulator [Pseudoroseomonas cervicalis]|uniref:helix-turn-helix transcriptional regulator n=1 Tax=Teichococcus cervicalis TaxID=204525 RepID=UPI00277F2155|nr:AraC family transcriptional regulator [Pseudoroseomonas cervicalis]MDQ1077626.1 AraC family transcriptional regulator [Pseudoroseomonas cervicalis]
MSLNPLQHAEHVTGCRQSALIDLWSRCGLTVAISEVTRPHLYDYGRLPVSTVAITLYNVRRHVLIEDGRTRRDAPVRFGRFRIGQPGRNVIVDAVPEPGRGKLVLFYLGEALLREAAAAQGHDRPVSLTDLAWETEDPFLTAAACRLVEASDRQRPPGPLLAEQLAYTVALHLTERHAALPPPRAAEMLPHHALPSRLRERVLADPAAPLGIAELAAEAGLSPSAFTRAFRRASGQTPHRFILEQRLQAARALLAESDRPLVDIALSLGFASQSHFGAAFRAATGASPARYRAARRG